MKINNKKTIISLILVIIIVIYNIFSNTNENSITKPSHIDLIKGQSYKVRRVVDGDTIIIDILGREYTVRMLGINTPETVDPRKPAECFGKQASDETKKILKDGEVKIETDDIVGQFDKYNRLLAYVSLNNQDINAYLIEQGFAREYTYDTKKPYSKRQIYKQLQKEAKKNKRGLWSQCEAGKFAPR